MGQADQSAYLTPAADATPASASRLRGLWLLGVLMLVFSAGCVEELDLETLGGDSERGSLVVEAVFTDQAVTQEVVLSRSETRLDIETDTVYNPFVPLGSRERDSVDYESNASVRLRAGSGQVFEFSEGEPGRYNSDQVFALQPGTDYTLEIRTSAGREYQSDLLRLAGTAQLQSVYAERMTNSFGVEGVQIYGDATGATGPASQLRFDFEETYKVVAPFWSSQDFQLSNYDPCALPAPTYNLEIVERDVQNRVCYNTVPSQQIIQTSVNPSTGELKRFPIRFIPRDDFIIAERYSILVKQLVQSPEAFAFYETLDALSGNDDLFSQLQPGPLLSNVSRTDGNSETILGYVEAVSVSQQRIFFNYDDLFPGEELPPYPINCSEQSTPESHISYCASGPNLNQCPTSIIERVDRGLITYTGENSENIGTCPGPYTFVNRACGDCTLLGDNEVPEFWVE